MKNFRKVIGALREERKPNQKNTQNKPAVGKIIQKDRGSLREERKPNQK